MYEIRPDGIINNPDGSHSIMLPNLPKNDELRQRPFLMRIRPGSVHVSGMSPFKPDSPYYKKATPTGIASYRRYFFGVWNSAPERFAEWKKANPDFVSI